jgi:hypothetical protein
MKIFCWGFLSSMQCVLANDIDEAFSKLDDEYILDNYRKSDAKIIEITNGVFNVYDIWEN